MKKTTDDGSCGVMGWGGAITGLSLGIDGSGEETLVNRSVVGGQIGVDSGKNMAAKKPVYSCYR